MATVKNYTEAKCKISYDEIIATLTVTTFYLNIDYHVKNELIHINYGEIILVVI